MYGSPNIHITGRERVTSAFNAGQLKQKQCCFYCNFLGSIYRKWREVERSRPQLQGTHENTATVSTELTIPEARCRSESRIATIPTCHIVKRVFPLVFPTFFLSSAWKPLGRPRLMLLVGRSFACGFHSLLHSSHRLLLPWEDSMSFSNPQPTPCAVASLFTSRLLSTPSDHNFNSVPWLKVCAL